MSIASEIARIKGNITSALTAISNKGVTVPTGSGSDDLATLIGQIQTGGGGVSNVVTGTFKGTTTGTAMDVTLNYSGSGWPIAVAVFVEDGRHGDSTFSSTKQRYAVSDFFVSKTDPDDAPDYSGNNTTANSFDMSCRYKSSSSNATSYTNGGGSGPTADNRDATNTAVSTIVKLRSKTKMSVYIASTSYGFMANINYRYYVIYSS